MIILHIFHCSYFTAAQLMLDYYVISDSEI